MMTNDSPLPGGKTPIPSEMSPHIAQLVQAHLTILQGIVSRMAANSTAAKTWCVSLVSAILVVIADKGKPDYALIALIPVIVFLFLDAYYLGFERRFRLSYNAFVKRLHAGELTEADLFEMKPDSDSFGAVTLALFSFSVWWVYVALGALVLIARLILVGQSS